MRKKEESYSALKRGEEKETLFTNLSFVQFGDIRLHCHALLLSEGSIGIFEPIWSIRGFGTEAAWELFDMRLRPESFPYTLAPFEDQSFVMLCKDGGVKPLFAGNILKFADGKQFFLQTSDSSRPIDIHVQQGNITRVWDILQEKAIEYWTAPHMPHLHYQSAEALRAGMMRLKTF